jgi:hypothetical protein
VLAELAPGLAEPSQIENPLAASLFCSFAEVPSESKVVFCIAATRTLHRVDEIVGSNTPLQKGGELFTTHVASDDLKALVPYPGP